MKRLLLLLSLSVTCFAQATQCNLPSSIITGTNRTVYVNINSVCNAWVLTYQSTGISAVSISVQTSDDNSSFSDATGNVTVGTNPSTTLYGMIQLYAYGPYIAVNVGTFTGTGSVTWQLKGSSGVLANVNSGGGGGGGCGSLGGDLSGTCADAEVVNLSNVMNASLLNAGLAHPSITVSGSTCVLGASCTPVEGGIDGVAFCNGFSPTSGQSLRYTTSSTPNPCWGAATSPTITSGTTHQTAIYSSGPATIGGVGPGTSGQCYLSNGASADPSFQTCPGGGGSSGNPFIQSWTSFNNGRTVIGPSVIPVTMGNTILVFVCSDTNPSSVTDSASNTYTELVSQSASGYVASMWKATASTTASLTQSANGVITATNCDDGQATEIAGSVTVDNTNSGNPFPSQVPLTTTSAGDILVIYTAEDNPVCNATGSQVWFAFAPTVIGGINNRLDCTVWGYSIAGNAGTYLPGLSDTNGVSNAIPVIAVALIP